MADQLSLFPSKDLPVEKKTVLPADRCSLDELFAACPRYRRGRMFREMLEFVSRFPQYSAFNGFLMFLQNPKATFVATAGAWEKRFGRRLKPDARPLAILAPMAPVLFLFDVADIEIDTTGGYGRGPSVSDTAKPAPVNGRLLRESYEKTVENCSVHGIAVRFSQPQDPRAGQAVTLTYNTRKLYGDLGPDSGSSYLIVLNQGLSRPELYRSLVHGLAHIFCGHLGIDSKAWWQDRRGSDQSAAEIEADTVSFLVLRRKGLSDPAESPWTDEGEKDRSLPAFSLNAAFQAVQYIEDMGKSLWQFPRKKSRYL